MKNWAEGWAHQVWNHWTLCILAFASASKADYFCTCDDNLLKKSQEFRRNRYQGGISNRTGDGVRHMSTQTRAISEISRQATHILFREMGVVDTIRFLNQFSIGRGDYTKQREQWLGEISMGDVISQIKAGKMKTQPD